MATHSSTLAWRIPWTWEPGRLQSMGSHRVGHDWSDLAAAAAAATVQVGSLFSTPSPAFITCSLFDDGHSDPCEVIPHCSFDLNLYNNEQFEHLFICLSAICMSPLRNVCLGLFPTFWLGCLFFWNWVVWTACRFWKLILCQLFHLLLFSPILRAVFSPCL